MKTKENHYQNPEFEGYVTKHINENLEHLVIDARKEGAENQPPLSNKNLKPVFQKHHLLYQMLINKLAAAIPIQLVIDEVIEHKRIIDEKIRSITNKLTDLRTRRITINADLEQHPRPFSKLLIRVIISGIVGIAIYESANTYQVYNSWGFGLLVAVLMSLFFAAGLTALPFVFRKVLEHCKTLWQKRLVAIVTLALLTAPIYVHGKPPRRVPHETGIG